MPSSPNPQGDSNTETKSPARNTVVVRIGTLGRPLHCNAGKMTLRRGDQVVIDDRRGGAVATVVVPSGLRPHKGTLARLVRMADEGDLGQEAKRERIATDTLAFARQKARDSKASVKFFRVEVAPRMERATVFFAAEQRIDFRDLVKEISAHAHMRVELRQVGVRDEAKMVGGIGSCGQELCCSTFLPRFAPVSIRMAKNQNLALTPSKISGQCGRLKCCLVYEDKAYIDAAKLLPRVGKRVTTPEGEGQVQDIDVLRGRIRVFFPDKPPAIFGPEDVQLSANPPAPAGDHNPRPGKMGGSNRPGTARQGGRQDSHKDSNVQSPEDPAETLGSENNANTPAPEPGKT